MLGVEVYAELHGESAVRHATVFQSAEAVDCPFTPECEVDSD